jgi:SAM-dependent methyltransferase
MATQKDKKREQIRYEKYATARTLVACGSDSISEHLRSPYLLYEFELQSRLSDQTHVLELGAGTGVHSGIPKSFGTTTLLDISHSSVRVNLNTPPHTAHGVCGDIELLPFRDASFHLVCGAGMLSYGNSLIVRNEIERVLCTGGSLVLVDSLNSNPIYRLNRRIHWLRGDRTVSTLRSMPTQRSLSALTANFQGCEIRYFDHWVFLYPPLRLILGQRRANLVIKWLNATVSPNWMAFKFVLVASNFQGSTTAS